MPAQRAERVNYGSLAKPPPRPPTRPVAPTRSTPPRPSVNLRSTSLPTQPFKPALKQAQQKVEHAQAALPPQPSPHLPYLPNPSPAQAKAALQIVAKHAQAIGPKAFAEQFSNPRERQFTQTVQHYLNAYNGQVRAYEHSGLAGVAAAQGKNPAQGLALLEQSRAKALPQLLAEQRKEAQQGEGIGPLKLATIMPLLTKIANAHLVPGGVLGDLANEAIDLPAQTFLSSAEAGSAAASAIQGKPAALQAILKGVASQAEHPIKSFEQAPLSTALLFAGGEAGVGGALGKVGRGLTHGVDVAAKLSAGLERTTLEGVTTGTGTAGKLAKAVATQRPDLLLTGGERITGRTYSSDPLRAALQKGYEKTLTKLPEGQIKLPGKEPFTIRQASPFQAEGLRLKRNMVGGVIRPGRVDYIRPAGERTRRRIVKGTLDKLDAHLPGGHADHAVELAAEGLIHPNSMEIDLRAERKRILAAREGTNATGGKPLVGKDLHNNKAAVAQIDALLADKNLLANPEPVFHAAAAYKALKDPLTVQRLEHGSLLPEQMRAAIYPYAQSRLGATRYDENGKLLPTLSVRAGSVHADGAAPTYKGSDGLEYAPLATQHVLEHAGRNGIDLTHVSHQEGRGKGGQFYQATTRPPRVESYERTGAAFEKGTIVRSREALRGSLANDASKAAQREVYLREINRLGTGRFETRRAAQKAAENLEYTREGQKVSQGLGGYVPKQLGHKQLLEHGRSADVTPTKIDETLQQFGLTRHSGPKEDRVGGWTLIPKAVEDRLQAHDNAVSAKAGTLKAAAQRYTQGFRRVKLYTSTRHPVGVAQELGIRLIAEDVGPRVLGGQKARLGHAATKHLESLDTPKGREIADQLGSRGSLYTSTQDNDIVRKGDLWQQTSGRKIPNPREAWQAYYKTIQAGMHKVEKGAYDPLLGKAIASFYDNWRGALKAQDAAMSKLENMSPSTADSIAKQVDDMMGNWSHQTPEVRRAVQTWSQFGLWWLNSMRWLYRLPVTHPIKTAIAAAIYNATREDRNAKGQGFDAAHPVPAFLTGQIDTNLPVVGKVKVNPAYYSPLGTAIEPTNTAAQQILPQFASILAAAKGENPLSGAKLKDAKGHELGPLSNLLNVGTEAVAGPTVGATQIQQLLQQGGKPYGTANLVTDIAHLLGGPGQVKPGTERPLSENLFKILFPGRFTFPTAGSEAQGGTGTGGRAGGDREVEAAREDLRRERQAERENEAAASDLEQIRRERREEREPR